MKTRQSASSSAQRKQILHSAIASFKIEGISISPKDAAAVLKKIEINLEKSRV